MVLSSEPFSGTLPLTGFLASLPFLFCRVASRVRDRTSLSYRKVGGWQTTAPVVNSICFTGLETKPTGQKKGLLGTSFGGKAVDTPEVGKQKSVDRAESSELTVRDKLQTLSMPLFLCEAREVRITHEGD